MDLDTPLEHNEHLKSIRTVAELDNESGFYQYVIRPMLSRGHEGELCKWLKEMGLIQRTLTCTNADNNQACNAPMRWAPARILDKYHWICNCLRKRSIREDSFFKNTNCSLTSCLRILLGWCKDVPPHQLSEILAIKLHIINKLYKACTKIVEADVTSHKSNYRLGGEGSVIMIDLYPEGCSKISRIECHNNNSIQILCIAEAKSIPTNYWFHVIKYPESVEAQLEAITVIETMVKPGSIIVADPNTKLCSYSALKGLKYPKIINIDELKAHNTLKTNILHNLATIWEPAVNICDAAQTYPQDEVQAFLNNMLWRRQYSKTPSVALEGLLHSIADHCPIGY